VGVWYITVQSDLDTIATIHTLLSKRWDDRVWEAMLGQLGSPGPLSDAVTDLKKYER